MMHLSQEEKVLLRVHKHWIHIVFEGIVVSVLALLVLFVVPVIFRYIFPSAIMEIGEDTFVPLSMFLGAAWVWFAWIMFFVMWTNYYLDMVVITNKRLIDEEQFVLFTRDEVAIPLENIEDVKIETKGLLATIFRFGNLQIQTAGATKEMVVKNIMNPKSVKRVLEECISHTKRPV